jgi:linoleoyl-CoA desaturase
MHDANHGSYSKFKWVNSSLSYVINFIGGNVLNWRLQHNVLHHTYTNIHGSDEDIEGPPFLRFSPHKQRKNIHRFQHYYAWFFYGLLTISWATTKDFIQLKRFKDMDFSQIPKKYTKIVWGLIAGKSFYFLYLLALPMIFSPVSVWLTLLGFMSMHFIAGIILSSIFQSAHIMPESEFPAPTEEGKMENGFAVHQILNTSNFAPKNPILSWYVGGLNFQVEHHLFPDICHVHYNKLSKIVKETTAQFGLPYYSHPTFTGALFQHFKMLKQLGKA